jgi:membrane protease subunit HflC
MKKNSLTIIVGAVLVVVFGMLLFAFQVRTTQVAVVTTFGKPTRSVTEPGLNGKWPWPVQKVYWFDNRIQSFEDKFTEDYTADKKTLLSSVYIGWRITDPRLFLERFPGGEVAQAENKMEGLLRTAKTATVGRHPLSDFVSVSDSGTNFNLIENEILNAVRDQVKVNGYGVSVEFLGIKRLGFPQSVTEDVFTQMTSERQVLVQQLQQEGDAEAQIIKSGAERRAAELLATAHGQALEIKGKGEAAAARSLEVFRQNPQLANFLFRLSALEEALKQRSTLIFDQQTPPFDVFKGVSTNFMTR